MPVVSLHVGLAFVRLVIQLLRHGHAEVIRRPRRKNRRGLLPRLREVSPS
jgi:hypothetical protein